MSLEAILTISEAEEKVKQAKIDSAVQAKKLIAEAEEAGKRSVEEAKAKAEAEVSELKAQARDRAREEALKLARNTENRKAAMLVKADSRAVMAVGLVIERIVNS